ncbi:PAS domain S-box protein [Flaviaesturariibacter amylovorans]|uniref:PAS domain S-box protein n=1 Tax=Flaviaesturariibacter amylovorans TaxID=1084520 RepID=A0ABP8GGB2_9BACT
MPPLKRLVRVSFVLLLLVILFNIASWFSVTQLSAQNRLCEAGGNSSARQQVYLQQVAGKVSALSIHHHFSTDQFNNQLKYLEQAAAHFRAGQVELRQIGRALAAGEDATRVQALLGRSEAAYAIVQARAHQALESAVANRTDPGDPVPFHAATGEYLPLMQQLHAQFLHMEQNTQARIETMNRATIISLIACLLFLAILVIAPIFRQSTRTYEELQRSLGEVRDSGALLRTVIDATPDLMFVVDGEQRFRFVNQALATELGTTPEALVGRGMAPTLLQGVAPGHDAFWSAPGNQDEELMEATVQGPGGTRYLTLHRSLLRNGQGGHLGYFGRVHDITSFVEAERQIQESERKYRGLFESNPMPMWIFDRNTLRFLEVNAMAVAHYGYSAAEFATMTILDIRPPEDHGRLLQVTQAPRSGERLQQGVWTHLLRDGRRIFVEVISHSIEYNGRPAVLVLAKDITRNIELQHELLEEKIAHQRSIARATVVVQEKERNEIGRELHDNVNQVLTSVKLHLEIMGTPGADAEKHRVHSLQMVASAIQEIRRLSRSLVPHALNDVGLTSAVDDLVEGLNNLGAVRFTFSHSGLDENGLPSGLKLTMLRIIQEQTTNILKYAGASEASVELEQEGCEIRLRITDNGVGFDPEQNRKGIGITNIMNRADIYHGVLSLQTAPGAGCVLSVSFDLNKVYRLEESSFEKA